MQEITVYETADGRRFDSSVEASRYEKLMETVATAMSVLRDAHPDSNGESFVQHDPARVAEARARLDAISGFASTWSIDYILRCMLDGADRLKPLERAYNRLWCIDDLGREWDQRYFVNHPNPQARAV